ncbi:MAG: NERD domain-containing protein [Anaerolineales bacterium]|nr:NERD domain-containing protein [Anaerolineales bacterium]
MKIIDKTPLQDSKGEISFSARVQGTLKYGLSWFSNLEAQKFVVTLLDRMLEKGYVLIRNFTLPGSDIVIPIILIGPFGIQVILVTKVKGFFEAKGDQWNTKDSSGRSQPAGINLIGRVTQYARALQKYLQFQSIEYPGQIEPVLISIDPGAHIESMRPAARVVLSDAIKQYAASLSQARPVLRAEQVYEFSNRIVNPLPPQAKTPLQPQAPEMEAENPAAPSPPVSRSQAIFNSEQTPFDPKDLGFAFEDEKQSASQDVPPQLRESSPAQRLPSQSAKNRKIMGLTTSQVILLAVMLIVECCVVIGFAYIISINQ